MQSNHRNAHRASVRLAFCGVTVALSMVLMLIGGLIQIGTYAAPLMAGILLLAVEAEFGQKWGWSVWFAVLLMSLVLGLDKEAACFYGFVGWYPLVKWQLDRRLRAKWLNLLVKWLIFAALVSAMYALLIYGLRLAPVISDFGEMGTAMAVLLMAGLTLSLLLYDRLLNPLLMLYAQRIRQLIRL